MFSVTTRRARLRSAIGLYARRVEVAGNLYLFSNRSVTDCLLVRYNAERVRTRRLFIRQQVAAQAWLLLLAADGAHHNTIIGQRACGVQNIITPARLVMCYKGVDAILVLILLLLLLLLLLFCAHTLVDMVTRMCAAYWDHTCEHRPRAHGSDVAATSACTSHQEMSRVKS